MLIEERLIVILKILEEEKSVTVQELTEILDASESTIRRDLALLHRQGKLIKVHGGATALGMNYHTKDDDVATRKDLNREDKIKVARYAASLIKPHDLVYIDAGTTTEIMIDYITEQEAVYVTNAMTHAQKLVEHGCTTYILGGELKLSTEAIVGSEALISLQKYNFTKGFWGTNGVCEKTGFSTPDVNEALVKTEAMNHCKECYVLCDPSKFNQISSVTFAKFLDATIISTTLEDKSYKKHKNIKEVE